MASVQPDGDEWTRRVLLKCVASLYDLLGLMVPITITGKILLQQAWKESGDWDERMSEKMHEAIAQWWGEIKSLTEVDVARWLRARPQNSYALHMFVDASEVAYGCCIYLLSTNQSQLLFAKAREAPLKGHTLARLELQPAFMGSNCLTAVCAQLRVTVQRIAAWTDGLTVLHWLQRPAYHWKTWVANRVAAIKEIGNKHNIEWKHCQE